MGIFLDTPPVGGFTGTLPVANGGTGSNVALVGNRIMISTATQTIVEQAAIAATRMIVSDVSGLPVALAAITANRALASAANGLPVASTTTDTELGFVAGVTSAIQTQINGKQATGNYITALTGDVTAAGPGSVAATIGANVVTNAKAAQMAANTMKGNNTGSTANAADLTQAQVRTLLTKAPKVTLITSGASNFTPDADTKYMRVKVVGGGGGGAGSGTAGMGAAGAGGTTSFGTTLLTAGGGQPGNAGGGAGGAGGTPSAIGAGASGVIKTGNPGGAGPGSGLGSGYFGDGGVGGSTSLLGAGIGGVRVAAGGAAAANSGSGGGGGGIAGTANANCGPGGGSGAEIEAIVTNMALAPFAYSIGAGGTAGTAGTSGAAGGAGGSGQIIIEEYYL